MLGMLVRLLRSRKGNVAITVALTLPFMIAGAGFGVEVGYWRYDQVRLQQAADAAAYAGAVIEREGGDATAAATAAATTNGYNSTTDKINVSNPSTQTAGDPNSVGVSISRTETQLFIGLFTTKQAVVTASATASYTTAENACILALSKNAQKAADFAGNSTLDLTDCTVMSDSIASNALNTQGSTTVQVPCMYSVGGATLGGSVTLAGITLPDQTVIPCPAVKTNQPPVMDPYKSLAMPTVSGNCSNGGNGANLNPGHYCSLDIKKNVTMQPGTYIIDGGNFIVNAGANLSGTGVTIYLVNGASLSFNGNADVNLSAPGTNSGTYSGMLIISDRSNTGTISVNGDNASLVTGTIYSPNGSVTYNGNFSGASGCTQIVASTVEFTGNSTFSDNCADKGMDQVKVGGVVRLTA